ncbi:MAG TPA: family 16 glycoside hydrolase [Bryobacteraceae bacterium]
MDVEVRRGGGRLERLEIVCRGTRIATWLNGRPAADFDGRGVLDDDSHRRRGAGLRGRLAFQLHTGDELLIDFKDVWIRLAE